MATLTRTNLDPLRLRLVIRGLLDHYEINDEPDSEPYEVCVYPGEAVPVRVARPCSPRLPDEKGSVLVPVFGEPFDPATEARKLLAALEA